MRRLICTDEGSHISERQGECGAIPTSVKKTTDESVAKKRLGQLKLEVGSSLFHTVRLHGSLLIIFRIVGPDGASRLVILPTGTP
jgi:hypothetical protein